MAEKINFKTKYYNENGKSIYTHVSYKTYDINGNLIDSAEKTTCFSSLTYFPIETAINKIIIYKELSQIPYDKDVVKKWIEELNELGFPCSVEIKSDCAYFTVKPKDFVKKFHFNSTLQLIRCLYERYICYVPDVYFGLIENGFDKFNAIQLAHLKLTDYKESALANYNPMITSSHNNIKTITQKEFVERIKKSIYSLSDGYSEEGYLYEIWRGEKPKKVIENY